MPKAQNKSVSKKSYPSFLKPLLSYKDELAKNKKKQTTLGLLLLLVVIAIVVYLNAGFFVVALVNNQPITRLALISELEKQGGKQVLDSLVTKKLIKQEASKKGVVISDSDVQTKVDEIESTLKDQGTDLATVLSFQGKNMEDFKEEIKFNVMVEKLLADKVSVTEDEIQKYFDDNKDAYEGQTFDEVKETIKQDLTNSKLGEAYQAWITEIKTPASIKYLVDY